MKTLLIVIILLLLPLLTMWIGRWYEIKKVFWYEIKYYKSTYDMIDKVSGLWYWTWLSTYIINKCKVLEVIDSKYSPIHCISLSVAIWWAESTHSKKSINYNIWWFRNKKFETPYKAYDRFIKSYRKYWYLAKPIDMYGKGWKHRYCTDEHSSGTMGWCPNWLRISNQYFNYLKN